MLVAGRASGIALVKQEQPCMVEKHAGVVDVGGGCGAADECVDVGQQSTPGRPGGRVFIRVGRERGWWGGGGLGGGPCRGRGAGGGGGGGRGLGGPPGGAGGPPL